MFGKFLRASLVEGKFLIRIAGFKMKISYNLK